MYTPKKGKKTERKKEKKATRYFCLILSLVEYKAGIEINYYYL
jgi:hypothetical protein